MHRWHPQSFQQSVGAGGRQVCNADDEHNANIEKRIVSPVRLDASKAVPACQINTI